MGLFWRALVVALLALPVAAYVTGSLVGARSELPDQRPPVVVEDEMVTEPRQTLRPRPTRPSPAPVERPSDDTDDAEDRDGDDGDEVPVVRPTPRDLDGEDDDRDDDGDDEDDDGPADGPDDDAEGSRDDDD